MATNPDTIPESLDDPLEDFLSFNNKVNESRPFSSTFCVGDQEYIVLKDVFISGGRYYNHVRVTDHLPLPNNEASVLEIGSGTGVLSCELFRKQKPNIKKIIATDINPQAVQNTKLNFEKHNIPGTVFLGDLFEAVPEGETFDLIFSFFPCRWVAEGKELTTFEKAYVDPGYKSLVQFISESRKYLSANGKCVLIFIEDIGDLELLRKRAKEQDRKLEIIWKDTLDFPLMNTKIVLQLMEVKNS